MHCVHERYPFHWHVRIHPSFGVADTLPFQGENKKMEDAKYYLTLPGSKVEMEEEELQASKTLANFTPAKDSTKDSFQIATVICSTKLTQNGRYGDGLTPECVLCLVLLGALAGLHQTAKLLLRFCCPSFKPDKKCFWYFLVLSNL